jgi:hypothetical protein
MQTIDASGQPLTLATFIKAYKAARKLAPVRFLQLRIHPEVLERLIDEAEEITEIVQFGSFTGHLGKQQTKVACVAAPNGLGDGMVVEQDKAADPRRLEFQIHGATELEVINLDEHATTIAPIIN